MILYIFALVPVTPWSVRCIFPRAQFIVSRDLHNSSVALYNGMVQQVLGFFFRLTFADMTILRRFKRFKILNTIKAIDLEIF